MSDYLRITLNARLAKMNERGASAVEYGSSPGSRR
jgi:hypothetical protein